MRVGYVLDRFPVRSETFITAEIGALLDRGHAIEVLAARRGDPDHEARLLAITRHAADGNRAARLIGRTLRHPRAARRWFASRGRSRAAIRLAFRHAATPAPPGHHAFDVVHAHFGPNGLRAALWRDLGVIAGPLVVTFHGHDMSSWLRTYDAGVYRPLFESGGRFLAVSERWRRRLVELGAPAERTFVHRVGIDLARFPFATRQVRPDEPVRLVSVARLVEKKGIEYALRALARVANETQAFEYLVIGDGPLRTQLEQLASNLGLSCVRFLGWQSPEQVRTLLDTSHALFAPSVRSAEGDEEGIPVAIMEAMAAGLTVIASAHSGIPELVQDGVTGLLAPERDADALSRCLLRYVEDDDLRRRLPSAARQAVEREHDLTIQAVRLENHYRAARDS